ncbi:MAG TPA: LysM peptidoglycan-binding domain-containing protein [Acidiferrobacterales bacterium]|nr:LysM peptidoglycan-binding domain-containing protein [Acidiferrobacterales bacterium]
MIQRISSYILMATLAAALAACATTKKEEPAPAAPAAAAPAPAPELKAVSTLPANYEVQRGDHLWGIASQPRIYGNPYAWPLIYKTNSAKIKDADLIHPGQNLDINRSASTGDIDAAVRHAKTRGAWKLGVTEDSDKAYLAGK